MRKSFVFLLIAAFAAMLGGCVLPCSPTDVPVSLSYGEQKTFSILVFPKPERYAWYVDGSLVPGATRGVFKYGLTEDLPSFHTVEVRAFHSTASESFTWNVLYHGTQPGNYIYLQSDPGDYIGQGQTYLYNQANSQIIVNSYNGYLKILINGDEFWHGYFQEPKGLDKLKTGQYQNVGPYPTQNPAVGGLDWNGEDRYNKGLTGWFAIDYVAYSDGELTAIDLRFEQHSSGNTPALHGQIHWRADDTTTPPGPVTPIPPDLWQPTDGTTPASGNYVYLQSDSGDPCGQGQTYTYTQANALITVISTVGDLSIRLEGDINWYGNFGAMSSITQLEPGYYGNLMGGRYSNPARGSLKWSGETTYINSVTGWYAVDDITYVDGKVTAFDLRFEQYSDGSTATLHGKIHWRADDPTMPPGPVTPIPTDLWQPAAGSTPSSGSYVYLQSDPGDYIGQGRTYIYTPDNAQISLTPSTGHLSITINGNEYWWGHLQAMIGIDQLQVGYYGNLEQWPFHNPVRGGLSWWGMGHASNTVTGWFAIDNVSYVNGALSAIDLRFEQHSEGDGPALHGQIHWSS